MDIGSGHSYPANALSNFTPRKFIFDGIECNSAEGLLQSFKFESWDMQKHVCTLVGRAAKFKGKDKKWWKTGKLYWKGVEIDRFGKEYQELLDRAYAAMTDQSESFRKALIASGDAVFTHEIGKNDEKRTILTVSEFVRRLNSNRARIRGWINQ